MNNRTFPLYNESDIRRNLNPDTSTRLNKLTVLESADSTNLFLSRLPPEDTHAHVVLADQQSAGQGRRGRAWHSPPGCNIYLSLGWEFQCPVAKLSQLPLAIAVCVARAVQASGVESPGIKWPNDIQVDGRKLGGILVDLRSQGTGHATAIVGVGLNVQMPVSEASNSAISQSWTDIRSHVRESVSGDFRDKICSQMIDELISGIGHYTQTGFQSFTSDWQKFDVLLNRTISISSTESHATGKSVGISKNGGLMVVCQDDVGDPQVREFLAGEVTVRPQN